FANQSIHFDICRVQQDTDIPAGSFDGIVISGSISSAYDTQEWIERLSGKIKVWADNKAPLLGICFGHQIIAQALGGVVKKNPQGWEVGVNPLELTDAGQNDPIFAGLISPFKVMQTHQDIVANLPPGAECLASSAKCAIQALRIGDLIRTVQFHPEYTFDHISFILEPRRERLTADGVDVDATINDLEPLPEMRTI
ncbi:MAG: type 1 glutamine amidotransferase, partial [Planctomycetes bacterium]|nr:type 1 glutamine amidotransferase [Planctomycetota bacterium]